MIPDTRVAVIGLGLMGGSLGSFGHGAMVKPFEEAAFAAKKGDIVGPVQSDFGYHVIRVTDIKPEKIRTLAEAAPEIEASIKKANAQKTFNDSVEQFSNLVYEQSTSLKPAFIFAARSCGLNASKSRRVMTLPPTSRRAPFGSVPDPPAPDPANKSGYALTASRTRSG